MIAKFIFLILLVSCSSRTLLKETTTKKEHNEKFLKESLDVRLWQEKFENRDRDVYVNKEKIVEALDISKSDHIVDVGAGTGFFLKLLNEKLGDAGKLYAVDISPGFVDFMKARKKAENLNKLTVIKGDDDSTNLKDNSVNIVFLCDTYHHFDNPKEMLKDLKRILRSGGYMYVVDFDRSKGKLKKWLLKHISKSKKDYIKEIVSHGYELVEDMKVPLEDNFMLKFRVK